MKRKVEALRSPLNRLNLFTRENSSNRIQRYYRGLAISGGIACFAIFIHKLPGFNFVSPFMLAILSGIFIRNSIGVPQSGRAGVQFSIKRLLRVAIVLLGLQLSVEQFSDIGTTGLSIIGLSLITTFAFTIWAGKWLGVNPKLTQLIAAGTSICGASAVIATNAVVNDSDENVAYAVAVVTLLGTGSMLLYPALPALLSLTPSAFGLWCGASIHEVAQVVAAAFQYGTESGEVATIAKLSRIVFLAPLMVLLGMSVLNPEVQENRKRCSFPIPWFVLFFIVCIGINSLDLLTTNVRMALIQFNQVLLTTSLAAMGLETDLIKTQKIGIRPLYLALLSWLFISLFSLGMIKTFYP